ncbi:MAG: DUF6094 domain-containing protein [Gammaproteobacteria bacterium]
MALMFQRLVRNYIKAGYFPTDGDTTERVCSALMPTKGDLHILDPCCGEGVALAEIKHALSTLDTCRVTAYGVEYDKERAQGAKQILDIAIHSDIQDVIIGSRQFGCLFLNPPYGNMVTDHSGAIAKQWKGRKRLEKLFFQLTNGSLMFGGVLVLIIPAASLDKDLSGWIARHYRRVKVFRAPVQTYKQVVVFGIKRRVADADVDDNTLLTRKVLAEVGAGDIPPELPWVWDEAPYKVPSSLQTPSILTTRVEGECLAKLVQSNPCLWQGFDRHFGSLSREPRRPLCKLNDWHMGLSLAAGNVSGLVKANDGRVFLIKGDTYKQKNVTKTQETTDEAVVTTATHTDIFTPVIRAIDMTPGDDYGRTIVIK